MKSPMRLGDPEYIKLVDKLMGHKHTVLTESECAQEVAGIEDGAKSIFEESAELAAEIGIATATAPIVAGGYVTKSGRVYKNKPGRPRGSKGEK